MFSAVVRIPPGNRCLPPIPDDESLTPTTIRRPRVPRMGTCVPPRPPATPTTSNSRSPCQSRFDNSDNRNSCELVVKNIHVDDGDGSDFRPSSAPSEHSYAEYLTTPLRPLTQRRSPSPKNPRHETSCPPKEVIGHHSRRSHSSNAMATRTTAVTPTTCANPDIINGMYRLKVKRSSEILFSSEFLGNKSLIRKYRQRRRGRKRHRSKEEAEEEGTGGGGDQVYDVVETSGEEGSKEAIQVPPLKPPTVPAAAPPPMTQHIARNQKRSGKQHHHHHQSSYDSPCRLVTMLVI
ncbi:unnamed protein product [Taenia asiatica]|uniref:Uncharacterized protein n=1 Tax=Taenia asiatica TaxID=60517 RepID=A0A0R3WCG9_TAEAS|nr:unnamed protein product [Taenia asiatica]